MTEKLYTISEVADKLGVSTKTLRRWEEDGKFASNRTLGGQRRYSISDLQILDAIKHGTIPSSRDLLTVTQAAALFGVTPTTIERWEEDGKIHPLITSGATYYPKSRLLAKKHELSQAPRYPSAAFEPIPLSSPAPTTQPAPNPPQPSTRIPLPPSLSTPRRLTPLRLPTPSVSSDTLHIAINLMTTIILIMLYHLTLGKPNLPPSPDPTSQIQGVAETRDPTLTTLDTILDKSGRLQPPILATNILSLLPTTPPTNPAPGTIYFDAGSRTLKAFTDSWIDLLPTSSLQLNNSSLISGSATMPAGSRSLTLDHPVITPESVIYTTFTSDFAPVKRFWLTKTTGSFTLHTDFPLDARASLDYIIIDSPPPLDESSTTPALLDAIVR